MEITDENVFNKWRLYLSEFTTDKYMYKHRKEHLNALGQLFINYNIKFEDAKMFKNRAMIAMTTREGRKGKGKYKGWKNNVLDDFDMIMDGLYVSDNLQPVKFAPDPFQKPITDAKIIAWVKEKYGDKPLILKEAHRIDSYYYMKFLQDTFFS